jgi:Ni/Co efflux regulator RcnB
MPIAGRRHTHLRVLAPPGMHLLTGVRMNSKKIIAVLVAMSLATSGLAFAQGRGDHDNRGDKQDKREDKREEKQERKQDKRDDKYERKQDRRYEKDNRGHEGRGNNAQWQGRGAGPNHSFYKGQRLPVEYRSRIYVVDDWRNHQLSPPPRGYHWVQTGGDYVLIAIATGLIAQLLLGNY